MIRGGRVFVCAIVIAIVVGLVVSVAAFVDLAPHVGKDFFFTSDDPASQADEQISRLFSAASQVILSARGDIHSPRYHTRIARLGDELAAIEGVAAVHSVARGPKTPQRAFDSPFWSRLLVGEDGRSTLVIALLGEGPTGVVLSRVEEISKRHDRPDFEIHVSGVPYVVELIRRNLLRDLVVFSLAAIVVFGLIVAVLFRSAAILLGAMVACVSACCVTLLALHVLGIRIGVLTINVATIVFIMTLHHVIYLSFAWKEAAAGAADRSRTVAAAIRSTLGPSAWVMLTTLLGFASLILVRSQPMRELGTAGAIGAAIALCAAYLAYPPFLHLAARRTRAAASSAGGTDRVPRVLARPHAWLVLVVVGVAIALTPGMRRLETDPSLLSYFARSDEIRKGLEYVDRNGGSSPLRIVVSDRSGAKLSTKESYRKLWRLQSALEKLPAVGNVVSLPLIMAEGKSAPFGFLFSHRFLLERMERPEYGRVARSFITDDRLRGLFILRMKESVEREHRLVETAAIAKVVRDQGFEPELMGGLYFLQGNLSSLVASSLVMGLGQLLLSFLMVALVVARSVRAAVAMLLTLALIPAILLGVLGHLRVPVDIVSAPAVNIALGMAIDDMIHMVTAARAFRRAGRTPWQAWVKARALHWRSIVGTMTTVSAGFAIFALSSFPPTRRFGLTVVAGSLLDVVTCLVVLPFLAGAPLPRFVARLVESRRTS